MCGVDRYVARCSILTLIPTFLYRLSAIAVGRDIFRADANTLVELLMRIQSTYISFLCGSCSDTPSIVDSPLDPGDTLLSHYLIATWAKICQAMGPEFEPYLPIVMPPLVNAAGAKADISVYGTFLIMFSPARCSFTCHR